MEFLINKNKNDTLDPLSIVIKLFIYAYKPIGTKISISNNRIYIQEIGVFQSTIRSLYRDSKNDINIIFFPIIYACKFYLSEEKKQRYLLLFNKLLDSFDKMKETYQGNEIIYSIDQLKNIIISFIDKNDFDPNTILPNYDSTGGKIKQDIYKHINSIWTSKRLNVVFGYVDEILDSTSNELKNNLINSLNTYMNCIDMISFNLITNL
jgi:hypothetical protein